MPTAFIGSHTEWDVASSSLTRYYYAGSTRIAMRKNNTVYYLLSDHLGSTSLTTDQNGQNPVKHLYLPWGEVRYSSGSLQTKYTYTGQYSNVTDFGLMYYNARYYDPLLSRFSSADTIVPQPGNPQDWDRYGYTRNNPINYTDPSGHMAWEGDGGGEGMGIVGIITRNLSAYYDWRFSGNWSYIELKDVRQGANDIASYITSKGGNGHQWIREYLGGTNFAKETIYHYPIRDMDGGWTSLELSTNDFLHAGAFVYPANTITFQPDQISSETVVHELGHVLDNYFGPSEFYEAALFGGGAADGLVTFLGGNPGGFRARGNQILRTVDDHFWLPDVDGVENYGNTSVTDFFATHFTYQVYGYPEGYISNASDIWMGAFIGVTINLVP